MGTSFESLSILWNQGKIPCCPASFHQGSSRSQWFKFAAGCFLFPVPAPFRNHYLLYRDHHQILLCPRMNFHTHCSRLHLSHHPSSLQYFQSVPSKQAPSCTVFYSNRVSRPKSTSQRATAYWWQKSPSRIQLPESKKPKPQLPFVCSLISCLDRSW